MPSEASTDVSGQPVAAKVARTWLNADRNAGRQVLGSDPGQSTSARSC